MTIAIALLLAVVTAGLAMRVRSETQRRRRAEEALEAERAASESHAARVTPLLTHELRSQIATVLGYQELLADGLLGEIQPEALEALSRVRRAGRQILALADGTGKLLAPRTDQPRLEPIDLYAALREAVAEATPSAASYGLDLRLQDPEPGPPITISSEKETLRAALDLLLGAVIRTGGGVQPAIRVLEEPHHALVDIAPTALDPRRDGSALADLPPLGTPATSAGLRLAMAAALLRATGGRIALPTSDDGSAPALRLVFPRAAPSLVAARAPAPRARPADPAPGAN